MPPDELAPILRRLEELQAAHDKAVTQFTDRLPAQVGGGGQAAHSCGVGRVAGCLGGWEWPGGCDARQQWVVRACCPPAALLTTLSHPVLDPAAPESFHIGPCCTPPLSPSIKAPAAPLLTGVVHAPVPPPQAHDEVRFLLHRLDLTDFYKRRSTLDDDQDQDQDQGGYGE